MREKIKRNGSERRGGKGKEDVDRLMEGEGGDKGKEDEEERGNKVGCNKCLRGNSSHTGYMWEVTWVNINQQAARCSWQGTTLSHFLNQSTLLKPASILQMGL